jgi:hypothetical protein
LDLLDGEDEGGGDGGGLMGVLYDDEGEVLCGVVDEPQEAVGAWQFHRSFLYVVFLLELVAHVAKQFQIFI